MIKPMSRMFALLLKLLLCMHLFLKLTSQTDIPELEIPLSTLKLGDATAGDYTIITPPREYTYKETKLRLKGLFSGTKSSALQGVQAFLNSVSSTIKKQRRDRGLSWDQIFSAEWESYHCEYLPATVGIAELAVSQMKDKIVSEGKRGELGLPELEALVAAGFSDVVIELYAQIGGSGLPSLLDLVKLATVYGEVVIVEAIVKIVDKYRESSSSSSENYDNEAAFRKIVYDIEFWMHLCFMNIQGEFSMAPHYLSKPELMELLQKLQRLSSGFRYRDYFIKEAANCILRAESK